MERLTFDGNFCEIAQCRELPCQYGGSCSQRKVWERLKEYEDTGLTPEEIARAKLETEAGCVKAIARTYGIDINRLRELAEADKDGRVIVTGAPSADKRDGLRQKYRVYKTKDNTPVDGCFVLRPEKDHAARIALEAYAKATDNKALSEDILTAIGDSGRVMVLPCKRGDTVWYVTKLGIEAYVIQAFEKSFFGDSANAWGVTFPFYNFGKNVFTTREEAEAKLKEVQKDD